VKYEFKPCPFCGSAIDETNLIKANSSLDEPYFYVKCFECGASTGFLTQEQFAVNVWNYRYKEKES